jgi:hypothetical protein
MTTLNGIKTIHTGIWLFFNVVLGYMVYAVVANQIDKWVWIGLAFVMVEGIVLFIFQGVCPLTLIARKYTNSTKNNFDIFLPNWLAKYNKIICTIIFSLIICMLIYRLIANES